MALDDYMEPEVAVAVALTAAVASPQVRSVLRKGAVYGLAGLLTVGDALSSVARGVGNGVQQMAGKAEDAASAADQAMKADSGAPVAEGVPDVGAAAQGEAERAPKRARKTAEDAEAG